MIFQKLLYLPIEWDCKLVTRAYYNNSMDPGRLNHILAELKLTFESLYTTIVWFFEQYSLWKYYTGMMDCIRTKD